MKILKYWKHFIGSIRTFFCELCTKNLLCGIFQINGNDATTAREILEEIASNDFSRLQTHKDHLKKYAPLFLEFIESGNLDNEECIPQDLISGVIKYVLDAIKALYDTCEPDDFIYGRTPTRAELPCDYFPHHDPIRGKANYVADIRRITNNIDHCNKISRKHKTLTEGVCTVYCSHGICHGFQLLQSHESPRTVFDILLTKFKEMPSFIIYDNSCNLHVFCMRREPSRFAKTKFLVDRLHAPGHRCSVGYHMKTYKDDEKIKNINSVLVEQSNARLKNLNNQISCMKSDNAVEHLALNIALRNLNKNIDYYNSF